MLCVVRLTNIWFVQCFYLGQLLSLHAFVFEVCTIVLYVLRVLRHTISGFVQRFARLYSEVMRASRHNHRVCNPSRFTHISLYTLSFLVSAFFCGIRLVNAGSVVAAGCNYCPGAAWFLYLYLMLKYFADSLFFVSFASLLASYCFLFVASSTHFSTFLLCVHFLLVQFNIWFTCLSLCYIQSLRPSNRYLYSIPFIHYGPVINPAPFDSFPFPIVA